VGVPGYWKLPRAQWSGLWRNGLSLRYFSGTVVLGLAAISSALQFSLLGSLGAVAFALLALVLWRLTLSETRQYFAFDISDT
jgi:hypothetical protein